MTRKALTTMICGLSIGVASCGSGSEPERSPPPGVDQSAKKPASGDWKKLYDDWEYPDPIPNFALTDQEGRTFSLADYDDRYVVVGFVFTSCQMPEACPLIMKKMRGVQEAWQASEKRGKKLQLIAFTIDPETDTPEQFKRWAGLFDADFSNWTLATGPTELMTDALPSLFNVMALPGANGSIRHTVKVAVLQPGLRDLKEWTNNKFEPQEVVDLILNHQPEPAKG